MCVESGLLSFSLNVVRTCVLLFGVLIINVAIYSGTMALRVTLNRQKT